MIVLAPNACRAAILLLCLLAIPGVAAQPFKYQWNVREIIKADTDEIELRTPDKLLLKKVDARQMRILYAVKSSIEEVAELTTELIIVDGKQANAFAGTAKSGHNVVGINFAMLDILGLDVHATAALLGHEIAHLKLKHGEQRPDRGTSGLAKLIGGIALSTMGVPGGGLISDLTVTAFETSYSRDHEREADYLGAIWAVEAGYEPDGAVRLHRAIYERSKSHPIPFLSSHPSGPDRINALQRLAARLSP